MSPPGAGGTKVRRGGVGRPIRGALPLGTGGGNREMIIVLSWEMNRTRRTDQDEASPEVEVLREVWSAQGQTEADLEDAFGAQKSCQRMADVGFEDMVSEGQDLRSAWRTTLQRDGKLKPGTGSVADLVLGSGADLPS